MLSREVCEKNVQRFKARRERESKMSAAEWLAALKVAIEKHQLGTPAALALPDHIESNLELDRWADLTASGRLFYAAVWYCSMFDVDAELRHANVELVALWESEMGSVRSLAAQPA